MLHTTKNSLLLVEICIIDNTIVCLVLFSRQINECKTLYDLVSVLLTVWSKCSKFFNQEIRIFFFSDKAKY